MKYFQSLAAITPEQFSIYRACLGLIGILDGFWFLTMGFHRTGYNGAFTLPLIEWARLPPELHQAAVVALLALAVFVMLDVFASAAALCMSAILLYVELSDWLGFHHGIFLSANLFMLLSAMTFRWRGGFPLREFGVVGTKTLIVVVYLFSGINKLSWEFLRGDVIEQMFSGSFMEGMPYLPAAMATGSAIMELAIPALLLWPRMRWAGFTLGAALHLGISIVSGAGAIFNFYVPVTYLLFMRGKSVRSTLLNPLFVAFVLNYVRTMAMYADSWKGLAVVAFAVGLSMAVIMLSFRKTLPAPHRVASDYATD